MKEILEEDECNDTYGRIRMYHALSPKQLENMDISSERTVYRIMEEVGIAIHRMCYSRRRDAVSPCGVKWIPVLECI